MTLEEARGIAARLYCEPQHSAADLCESIAQQLLTAFAAGRREGQEEERAMWDAWEKIPTLLGAHSLAALVQARREHVKQLALIGGMCGHPDAAEACRLIVKKCRTLAAALGPGTEPG